eukprot:9205775-Pyramimonas_sp.AAC.1
MGHVSASMSYCIVRADCRLQCVTPRYFISEKPTVHQKKQLSPPTAVFIVTDASWAGNEDIVKGRVEPLRSRSA